MTARQIEFILMTARELGCSGILISRSAWAHAVFRWGLAAATAFPLIEQAKNRRDCQSGCDGGITWFATAEIYGRGRPERALSSGLTSSEIGPRRHHRDETGRCSAAAPKASHVPSMSGSAR